MTADSDIVLERDGAFAIGEDRANGALKDRRRWS